MLEFIHLLMSGTNDRPTEATAEETDTDGRSGAALDMNSEVLLQNILDGLEEAILVVDADGMVTHLNERAVALFDTTRDAAVGTPPHELQDADSPGSPLMARALETGEEIQQREESIVAGGRTVPVVGSEDRGSQIGRASCRERV